ncbi:MAG: hypothetical protein H0W25_15270 [Acidimicrobiia bacterium]|nr:hypothetical protein [Acidimicrobiia bacterium]
MRKGIRYAVAAAAMVGGLTLGQAGSASAAHCIAPAGEEPSPGFSYFGNDHVAEDEAHGGSPEGGNPGPHAGTSGASNCRATTGSPSDRAPGKPNG